MVAPGEVDEELEPEVKEECEGKYGEINSVSFCWKDDFKKYIKLINGVLKMI